ncbi:16S rRNA (guanine(527)-N(7))-methyltransferase RsmG [Candidatus Marinamargulisbacteria bacterium SCGC AG-439-L15]|nr:16S rRNA (guanine(527)-N(7))-methyltransferase RsmG [Candidatus Marinamargulisbacteria bacterium SCGC AG-439-L15]
MSVSDKVAHYIKLLKEYNETTNIYSKSAYDKLSFHCEDSLVLSSLLSPKDKTILDMGSGSGLPSAILAIANPDKKVIAVESKSRKRNFLFHVKQSLSLDNYEVFEGDVQMFTAQNKRVIDVVTAKAFAKPPQVLAYAKKALKKKGVLYIPISRRQAEEDAYLQENFTIHTQKNHDAELFLYAQHHIF